MGAGHRRLCDRRAVSGRGAWRCVVRRHGVGAVAGSRREPRMRVEAQEPNTGSWLAASASGAEGRRSPRAGRRASQHRRRAAASCPRAGLQRGEGRARAGGRRCGGLAVALVPHRRTEVRLRRRRFVAMRECIRRRSSAVAYFSNREQSA